MDIFALIETFGLPVAMVIALGFYISKKDKQTEKEQKWIREELSKENRESFQRLEDIIDKDFRGIVIGLINAQKETQIKISELNRSYKAIVEIMCMLEDNGLKKKWLQKKTVEEDW
tara:strand:+ start:40 stop:387 length:348 start_codon:yes stop_codon:yes gene_type:complete